MKNYVFDKLCCISANKEQMVFERGSQKVILEFNLPNVVPLGKYDFELIKDKDGEYKVVSFDKDKFGIVEFVLESDKRKITIFSHMDAFERNSMEDFVLNTKFDFTTK